MTFAAIFAWLKDSWLGKAVAGLAALAVLIGAIFLYNKNQQNIGARKKEADDLKVIEKKVETQNTDIAKHSNDEGDNLADELKAQQKEFRQ